MGRTSSIFKKAFYVFFILSFSHSFAQDTVNGKILDSINNKPLSGVRISSRSDKNLSLQTDQNGNFTIQDLQSYPFDLKIQKKALKSEPFP